MRIRTVKPDFWSNEGLSALPEATHMLAAQLLNYCDDEGFFNANPALVKAACSPLREPSVNIGESLTALQTIGYLRLGTGSDGRRYGQIVKFVEHQRVNRPTASKIKDLGISWESSRQPQLQLSESSPLEGKGKEGKGKVGEAEASRGESPDLTLTGDPPPASGPAERVFVHWQVTHGKLRTTFDAKRRRLAAARLKDYSEQQLKDSISGYRLSAFHNGENEDHKKYLDFELMLRDARHVDAGIELFEQSNKSGATTNGIQETGRAGRRFDPFAPRTGSGGGSGSD